MAARSSVRTPDSAPPYRPNGVRTASQMKTERGPMGPQNTTVGGGVVQEPPTTWDTLGTWITWGAVGCVEHVGSSRPRGLRNPRGLRAPTYLNSSGATWFR